MAAEAEAWSFMGTRTATREIFYQIPDAGIRFLVQPGNHDGWASGTANYWNSFGENSKLFAGRTSWYLTNHGYSSYMLVDAGNYNSADNTDVKIVKTFTKEELRESRGADGYYTLAYTAAADADLYFRVRGTSTEEVDE